MRSKQFSSAILASGLALGLITPVMAGGLHAHPWHHKRYVAVPVVVEPAPVVRYRVTERIVIREVTPGTATRALGSPQVTYGSLQMGYRGIQPAASAIGDVRVVRVDRPITSVAPPAQERGIGGNDPEAQALGRLQSKVEDALKNPVSTQERGLGTGESISDNDLEPVPR